MFYLVYERDDMKIVVRTCGWIQYHQDCYSVKNDDHEEVVCQCFTRGCNGAVNLQPSMTVGATLALVYWSCRQ